MVYGKLATHQHEHKYYIGQFNIKFHEYQFVDDDVVCRSHPDNNHFNVNVCGIDNQQLCRL